MARIDVPGWTRPLTCVRAPGPVAGVRAAQIAATGRVLLNDACTGRSADRRPAISTIGARKKRCESTVLFESLGLVEEARATANPHARFRPRCPCSRSTASTRVAFPSLPPSV